MGNKLLALRRSTTTPETAKDITLLVQVAHDGLVVIAGFYELFTVGNEGAAEFAFAGSSLSEGLHLHGAAKVKFAADGGGVLIVLEVLNNDGNLLLNESTALLRE